MSLEKRVNHLAAGARLLQKKIPLRERILLYPKKTVGATPSSRLAFKFISKHPNLYRLEGKPPTVLLLRGNGVAMPLGYQPRKSAQDAPPTTHSLWERHPASKNSSYTL